MSSFFKLLSVKYQRNGVCGEGFYVVRFDWKEKGDPVLRRMIGHLYPEREEDGDWLPPRYYGVVDIDNPELAWRGDNFAIPMLGWVQVHDAEEEAKWKDVGPYRGEL